MHTPAPSDVANYMALAQKVMLHFQLVEEGLKAYLSLARQVIQRTIPKELDFRLADEEIDAWPLGRLTSAFARHSRNAELVQALNRLRPLRNHVSHKAFAYGFYSDFTEEIDFAKESRTLMEAHDVSAKAFEALALEIDAISNLLKRHDGHSGA